MVVVHSVQWCSESSGGRAGNVAITLDTGVETVTIDVDSQGRMVYNLATINGATYVKFDRDDLRSRWQGQLGLRLRF